MTRGPIDVVFKANPTNNQVDNSIDYSEYKDAIDAYTGLGYVKTNRALRNGMESRSKVLEFLDKAPENFKGSTYRGTRLNEQQQAMVNRMTAGDVLSNVSPLSTSVSSDIGTQFVTGERIGKKKPTLLTIEGSGHDISVHSGSPEEAEVLMKPGKFFKVVDKFITDSQAHLHLKEITEEEAKSLKTPINKSILAIPAVVGLSQMKDKQNEKETK